MRLVEAFFIRKRKWRKIVSMCKKHQMHDLIEDFKSNVLLRYIDKVYLPIKGYQDQLINYEKE